VRRQAGVRRQPLVNRALAWVLRSPVSGAVDGSLLLLTLRGRRTGRAITLPVQYAVGPDALWVWPGRPETKTWWRNLAAESAVEVRLRGQAVAGAAVAVRGDESGAYAYAARFPGTSRRAGLVAARAGAASGAATSDPLVRISVPSDHLDRARAATVVPGRGLVATVRRHPLGAFFLLAFAVTWGYWIPVALTGGSLSHFPGLLGPLAAAFLVAAIHQGGAGTKDLLARMVRWRVAPRWYAAALVPGAVGLLAVLGTALAGGGWPSASDWGSMAGLPAVGWLGVLVLVFLVNGYGEEVGWRGFAWPRLRERHTIAGAALVLTAFWFGWHLPAFWIDTGMREFERWLIPGWIVGLAAGAVVLGWLYERSGSSLLIVAVFHTMLNMASATPAGEGVPRVAVSMVVIAWAVLILRNEYASTHPTVSPPDRRFVT
jgi:uncharacterized protein